MKKCYKNIFLVFILVLGVGIITNTKNLNAKTQKSSFITNNDYVGTYGFEGEKGSYEKGWYNLIIKKITSTDKIHFMISKGGLHASPLYETDIIKTKIKGNKAVFKYEDSWGNKGKGSIVFKKNGTLFMKVKQTYKAEFNRSSLEISKTIFKKVS